MKMIGLLAVAADRRGGKAEHEPGAGAFEDGAFGRSVQVQGSNVDRYGRLVGKLLSDRGDCNLVQIQRGMAWHYKGYEREQSASERRIYAGAELQARRERAGLWQLATPQPPWEFRREQRE